MKNSLLEQHNFVKKNITLICGGQSTEHAISIQSARSVGKAIDAECYQVNVIYITEDNGWYMLPSLAAFLSVEPLQLVEQQQAPAINLPLQGQLSAWSLTNGDSVPVDCVFPLVHGTQGEDGVLQGLLELLQLPYVGSNVLGSAICNNKIVTKTLLKSAGLPVVDWLLLSKADYLNTSDNSAAIATQPTSALSLTYQQCSQQLGEVLFVKAVDLGSSVAIYKVQNESEFLAALQDVFRYSEQALIESCIVGREIECAVLGHHQPFASHPGEIIAHDDFYSYRAKYILAEGAEIIAKANLPAEQVSRIQTLACDAFKVLHACGLLRVDFFIDQHDRLWINEANTIPGFTAISLYPQMWAHSGVSYSALLTKLIELAFARDVWRSQLIKIYKTS